MDEEVRVTIVRRAVIGEEQRPVPIFSVDTLEPIDAEWVAIVRVEIGARESYSVGFYKFDGTRLATEQFETLEIAMDQAWDITGIPPSEWESCAIDITDHEENVPWLPYVE